MRMRLRIFTLLLMIATTGIGAFAQHGRAQKPFYNDYFEVSGYGAATASDNSSADSAAFAQAQYNAMAMCNGYAYNLITTSDVCNSANDGNGNTVFSCSVGVSLTCWVVVR